jgi:hypothetical protein
MQPHPPITAAGVAAVLERLRVAEDRLRRAERHQSREAVTMASATIRDLAALAGIDLAAEQKDAA